MHPAAQQVLCCGRPSKLNRRPRRLPHWAMAAGVPACFGLRAPGCAAGLGCAPPPLLCDAMSNHTRHAHACLVTLTDSWLEHEHPGIA